MAKQSLAMMVFMAMVSEGYAVRVGAKTDAQAEMFDAIDSKFEDPKNYYKNLEPWKELIDGLKKAETLNEWQVGSLKSLAEVLEVDRNVIDAVRSEVSKSEKVLSAIKSELREHQVPDTKTTMLRGFETMVRQGKLADDIRDQVGEDKESAESFVRALLLEAEQNADMKLQLSDRKKQFEVAKAKKRVLDAIELHRDRISQSVDGATVVSDPKTTMLLEIKTVVEKGELADQIFEHVTDEATAKSFVDDLLWEAEDNAALSAKKAKYNVLSAIKSELQEHPMSLSGDGEAVVSDPKTPRLSEIETMVRQGELADFREQVTDEASVKSFVSRVTDEHGLLTKAVLVELLQDTKDMANWRKLSEPRFQGTVEDRFVEQTNFWFGLFEQQNANNEQLLARIETQEHTIETQEHTINDLMAKVAQLKSTD